MREWNTDLPNLIDQSFWTQPAEAIDAVISRYHAEAPLAWFEEPFSNEWVVPGPGYWCVIRHADVGAIYRNSAAFSSTGGLTLADYPAEFTKFFGSLVVMDDPQHARLRRIVAGGFTPKMLRLLDRSIRDGARELVDAICEQGASEFIQDVAAALPLRIVCDLMGIPRSQHQFVFDCTNVIVGLSDPEYHPPDSDIATAALQAGADLSELIKDVAAAKRGGDGEDLTSIAVNAESEEDRLSDAELASLLMMLAIAGNVTTHNAAAWGLKFLTDHPEQRAIWMADFEGVAPTAVDEIVRFASPVNYIRRTASRDIEIGGHQMLAGDKVALISMGANRDPAVFDDPFKFDVRRDPNPHYGFGGPGPHFCLGAHLARHELTTIFRELLTRLPDIVAVGEPDLLRDSFIRGVKRLDAEFTPAAPLAA